MPGKDITAAQPVTAAELRFTKGKGPGRGNSYLARYEEDYSYLRDPGRSRDPFDPLKLIPLDPAGDIYLTINGETRFRYDYTDHRSFGVAGSATPAKLLGGVPLLTPATGTNTNQLYKQRYALGGDLHLGPNLRFCADLYHGQQTGHDVGPAVPGNQWDEAASSTASARSTASTTASRVDCAPAASRYISATTCRSGPTSRPICPRRSSTGSGFTATGATAGSTALPTTS